MEEMEKKGKATSGMAGTGKRVASHLTACLIQLGFGEFSH